MIISEYSNGFTISLRSSVALVQKADSEQSRRGCVTRFSAKSCSRLRHLLMRLVRPSDKLTCAITLTLPSNISPEDWRSLLERFRTRLARIKVGMVWRVELQKRKVPHLHCVAICDNIDTIGEIWNAWVCSCDSVCEGILPVYEGMLAVPVSCHAGFLVYGFSCRIVSSAGWFSYVAGHAFKHKRSQLGWQGRQWGVFNNKFLSFEDSQASTVDDDFMVFVCRCIRKKWRFSKLTVNSKGGYDFFVSPSFMTKCKQWFYRDMPI